MAIKVEFGALKKPHAILKIVTGVLALLSLALYRGSWYLDGLASFSPLHENMNSTFFFIGSMFMYTVMPLMLCVCYVLGQTQSVQGLGVGKDDDEERKLRPQDYYEDPKLDPGRLIYTLLQEGFLAVIGVVFVTASGILLANRVKYLNDLKYRWPDTTTENCATASTVFTFFCAFSCLIDGCPHLKYDQEPENDNAKIISKPSATDVKTSCFVTGIYAALGAGENPMEEEIRWGKNPVRPKIRCHHHLKTT
ncbi:unnamed protein product [Notodromas monacha]|uniref:Uncharacterized protein n=1 Tax=Notodromas monacha TaxID=399045 RepID=A0A7R9GK71_9CRUS|nr:unnamed protein product [Notodromas monacha]CAG0923578.1 unnamed protein product [Notodromas monacha]